MTNVVATGTLLTVCFGGEAYDTLPDAEVYGYERVVGSYMSLIYSAFMQHERDLVDDEVWDAYSNALGRHIKAPGFATVWENIKVGYPVSFQAEIARRFPTDGSGQASDG